MQFYWIHCITEGRSAEAEGFQAACDEAAVNRAREVLGDRSAELWKGAVRMHVFEQNERNFD